MANHWLVKTEPSCYSWQQLQQEKRTRWDGVRNALAIKHIGQMQVGDAVLVYHTGDERTAMGIAKVVKAPYPDPDVNDPKRLVVDLAMEQALKKPVPLATLKEEPVFRDSLLLRIGRLSVLPVTTEQWKRVIQLAK